MESTAKNLLNRESGCPECYRKAGGHSKIERNFQDWIKKYIKIMPNQRFYDNKKYKYELDVYIPSKKLGIELNGTYFHSEITGNKDKWYHINKTNFFKEKNITVIHFWEFEWNFKKEIVKSMIINKCNLNKNKLYARKCNIKEISPKEAKVFHEKNHLQGYRKSNINIGLFFKKELIQVASFSKPIFNSNFEYELIRFSTKLYTSVVGGFSKILKYFNKNYSTSLISYADKRYSKGEVYEKNGFELVADNPPNYLYTKNHSDFFNRISFQKHKLKEKLDIFDSNLTEWENMKLNNYDRIWDCGTLTYKLTN